MKQKKNLKSGRAGVAVDAPVRQFYRVVLQLERNDKNKQIAELVAQAASQIARSQGCEGNMGIVKLELTNVPFFDFLPNVPGELPRSAGGRGAQAARVPA